MIVTAEALRRFTTEVFVRAGMTEAHAATLADALVWANLRGVDSHGVVRIPRYVELIEIGDINPTPALTIRTETAAAVLLEADRAAGPIAMTAAMAAAVAKARAVGVGLSLVRGTTHTAALGLLHAHGRRRGDGRARSVGLDADDGLSRGARRSTNPISIAVPGGRGPMVLDMATGVVSMGRLLQARRAGQPIPPDWALDGDGNPTTDPRKARIPRPLGGPKGAGLLLMIECLTSLVVSNVILADALEATPAGRHHKQNALALAIDLARFGDPEAFRREIDRLIAALKALPRDPAVAEILMPGERGQRTFEQRRRDGVPLPSAIVEELQRLATRLGVTMFAPGA